MCRGSGSHPSGGCWPSSGRRHVDVDAGGRAVLVRDGQRVEGGGGLGSLGAAEDTDCELLARCRLSERSLKKPSILSEQTGHRRPHPGSAPGPRPCPGTRPRRVALLAVEAALPQDVGGVGAVGGRARAHLVDLAPLHAPSPAPAPRRPARSAPPSAPGGCPTVCRDAFMKCSRLVHLLQTHRHVLHPEGVGERTDKK
ncbi:hypothetical protein SKAU_G00267720 [Synaphobranchus kaupii]|uniref:Uncharacterized protein n=1 Tax=Synaphobranchus kaupii TaxID=118154 RepID=A0A9Q1EZP5_SYNKA|nr:hypothetical protein SKAU_G00267720 [Synaphobranchus kaupii]